MRTDRGTATMSAWLFTATGAEGDLAYPAVPASAFWGGSRIDQSSNGGASVSADGLSLTFFFIGSQEGNGPCQANYKGVVAESRTAVALSAETVIDPKASVPSSPGACQAMGYQRSVRVTLDSPLGGRVVVDSRGAAVAVCPEAAKTRC
jgi:hypothetical protein